MSRWCDMLSREDGGRSLNKANEKLTYLPYPCLGTAYRTDMLSTSEVELIDNTIKPATLSPRKDAKDGGS